jgi:hypothetical protein
MWTLAFVKLTVYGKFSLQRCLIEFLGEKIELQNRNSGFLYLKESKS